MDKRTNRQMSNRYLGKGKKTNKKPPRKWIGQCSFAHQRAVRSPYYYLYKKTYDGKENPTATKGALSDLLSVAAHHTADRNHSHFPPAGPGRDRNPHPSHILQIVVVVVVAVVVVDHLLVVCCVQG